jgi:hypothetical protein
MRATKSAAMDHIQSQQRSEDDESDVELGNELDNKLGNKVITIQDLFDFLDVPMDERVGKTPISIDDVPDRTFKRCGVFLEQMINKIMGICIVGDADKMKIELSRCVSILP